MPLFVEKYLFVEPTCCCSGQQNFARNVLCLLKVWLVGELFKVSRYLARIPFPQIPGGGRVSLRRDLGVLVFQPFNRIGCSHLSS